MAKTILDQLKHLAYHAAADLERNGEVKLVYAKGEKSPYQPLVISAHGRVSKGFIWDEDRQLWSEHEPWCDWDG